MDWTDSKVGKSRVISHEYSPSELIVTFRKTTEPFCDRRS